MDDEEPKPRHIATCLRVIRGHLKQRFVSIEVAHDMILEAALATARGDASPAQVRLVGFLQTATDCSIAELALIADAWPI